MMDLEEVREAFADGVAYVTREGWVDAAAIADPVLREMYRDTMSRYEEYRELCTEFEGAIYAAQYDAENAANEEDSDDE